MSPDLSKKKGSYNNCQNLVVICLGLGSQGDAGGFDKAVYAYICMGPFIGAHTNLCGRIRPNGPKWLSPLLLVTGLIYSL